MLPLGFAIEAGGKLLHRDVDFQQAGDAVRQVDPNGVTHISTRYRNEHLGLEVKQTNVTYPGLDLVDSSVELGNRSAQAITVTRVDTISGTLPADQYTLRYFRSDWGMEFSPTIIPLTGTRILEGTAGRSTKGMHPWFSLQGSSGQIVTGLVAWSGNWIIRFEPLPDATYRLSAGLSNWHFAKALQPGQSMEAPHFIYVHLPKGDLTDTSIQFGRWGRKFAYPHNRITQQVPCEWNHWWPYEDVEITEQVFKSNVDVASRLGIEMCTLDAGWFGPADEKSEWYKVRGDWHLVNTRRFPSGIASLSTYTHSKGPNFGIWCEIEALGEQAELAKLHPEYVATRDGKPLGYVCFGNPQVQDWAFGVVEHLIKDYGANWIKFDFNLDPGDGCNRTDHGHGAGDGLYEHYLGYYRFLDRIRSKYPDVFLENCSSGGLRVDLGMLQHLHATFLSDPDYTVHVLQSIWGASTMIHPSAMLHFTWSQTRPTFTPNRINNPVGPDTPDHKFDYLIRTSMMGIFSCSYRLADWPQERLDRLQQHITFYKQHVRDLLRDCDFYALTGQTNRDGTGDRWNAFLALTEAKDRGVLFVFRTTGSDDKRQIHLRGLNPTARYTITLQDRKQALERTSEQLMREGLQFEQMPEESSEIALIQTR